MRALIVADGDVPSRSALDAGWPGWADDVELIVAADGGWDKAAALGLRPALLVGDADSLPEDRFAALAAQGVPIERSPAAKDESDAELALLAALRRGATHVTILGALGGGRFDHALANVGLLALPEPGTAHVELLDETTRVRLLRAPAGGSATAQLELRGTAGDLVSLQGCFTRSSTKHFDRAPPADSPTCGSSSGRAFRSAEASCWSSKPERTC